MRSNLVDGNAAALPTSPDHPDQEPTTVVPVSPLQVAHHLLSEASSRRGEGVEPEGQGVDERSITSTSSRGALQHPGHRQALVTLLGALHRVLKAAQQGSSAVAGWGSSTAPSPGYG